MPIFSLKKKVSALLGLCLLAVGFSGAAFAGSAIPLHDIGLRYYPAVDELCITQDNLPQEALVLFGADSATVLAAMEHNRLFLICLTPEGRQVSLRLLEKPKEIALQSAFELQAQEKEAFLMSLSTLGHYLSASWQDAAPGFALFSTYGSRADISETTVTTLALSTLYLNQIYTFETDIIGRTPDEADTALLLSVAERMLFLGAENQSEAISASSAPLELPQWRPPTDEDAVFTEEIGAIPLALSPFPKFVATTSLSLSGTTSPNAYVRYAINGKASSRFRANKDGSFSVTMKGLTPDAVNDIEVTAFDAASSSSVRFSIDVQWQSTPLALSQTSSDVYEDSFTLEGLALPGTKVQLIRRQGSATIPLREDGSFSYAIATKKVGNYAFTVRALAAGYHRTDIDVTLNRQPDAADQLQTLLRKAKAVSYEKLALNPSAYQNQALAYQGVVTALANDDGQPCFLLEIGEGQSILCQCNDLLNIELGQSLHVIGAPLGHSRALKPREGGAQAYPALELLTLVP